MTSDLLSHVRALLPSSLERVELGAFPNIRAHQGLRCHAVRLSSITLFPLPLEPRLRTHTHRPCQLPPTQDGPARARALSSSQARGLHSCWLIRHLLGDTLGGPVTSALRLHRGGVQVRNGLAVGAQVGGKGTGVRKRKKLVLRLTVKHCRWKPPGVLCRLLCTETAAGIWGPALRPRPVRCCPEGQRADCGTVTRGWWTLQLQILLVFILCSVV